MEFDDERPKRKIEHEIGSDLSLLSVDELELRIKLMQEEILRLEADVKAKSASKDAAESLFKI